MSWLVPLSGSVVAAEFADAVVPPSYDSLSRRDRQAMMRAEPRSFFYATTTLNDYPGATKDSVLGDARKYVLEQQANGSYDAYSDAMFIYRLSDNQRTIQGVVGDVDVAQMGERVLRHEKTRVTRENEILRYLQEVGFEYLPVSLTYRSTPEIARMVAVATDLPPIVDLHLSDGSHHLVWAVTGGDAQALSKLFDEVDKAYITDGHHRTAAAERHAGDRDGAFLAVAFPDDDLHVFPYHRWVNASLPADHGLNLIESDEATPPAGYVTIVTAEGTWLTYLDGELDEDDTLALARTVLGPALGITDARTDSRLRFVPGAQGPGEVQQLVQKRGGTGFIVHGATLDSIMRVADEGGVMPPKSTWFEPKPRSGIFIVPR